MRGRNAGAPVVGINRGAEQTAFRAGKRFNDTASLRHLLGLMDEELVIVELGAYAAYFGDPLPEVDRERVLLAIRRLEAIRGAANARLR